ncbi:putative ABC transport system permease protein [Palleronia marisminoris]|uniref:FtsX-like permease family protein n=1 Tax=Palleronia marisminoris TaxID=315423 RepID=A0A1Y5T7G0_9RHOB|nr:ABC transporter permease [Palleronia marisminoris]SFH21339.1 putative ABC transport system permease protein [Palleronia marisminoris]SLN57324.1 FtsX-like permease family protein [Palleronia marisminoris]
MIGATLRALLSHWWRRPFQLVTLMVGLATATALWSGVQAINAEARASYDRAATTLAAGARPRLVADGPIPQRTYIALRRAGHDVSPVLEGSAAGLRIIGIDPFTLPPDDLPQDTGAGSIGPDFIGEPGQLLVAPGTEVPDSLPPATEAEGIPPGAAYADIGTAQRVLNRPGELSALIIAGPSSMTAPPIADIAPTLRRTGGTTTTDVSRLTGSFHLNLTAFGFLSFAVGLFIVRGAIGLAFEQRRGVFRTLRALGLPRGTLLALLSAELLILSLVAGAIGIALGYLVATLLIPDVAATLRGLYGAEVAGELTLRPAWWLSGFAIATLGTAIAAAASLWQTARMPLLAPANPRAWSRASAQALWLQAGAAALCLAVAAVAWGIGGLAAGFVLLGGLLLSAALALPLILRIVLRAASRTAQGPRAQWFWADAEQQLPGLSLALMALLLALAANIGVGTMVSSFRLTFTGWLDQRLAAELNLRAETEVQADEILAFLGPRVDAILPIRSTELPLAGAPAQLVGVADHPTYSETWPLIARQPDTWERVNAGDAALINAQLARRNDLWPGAMLEIAGRDMLIAGVYSDYGNPRGEAMVGLERFDTLFPDIPALSFSLRLDPAGIEDLTRDLRDRFDLPESNIMDQASVKRASLAIFERTFTVTGALNVLTLGVAGLAILTSLLTIATMRLPQLAPVWALGFTRRRLAMLDLGRAVMLAALTFVLSLPVGIALAWVLLSVINVEAFGWKLPLRLFPLDWLRLLVLSLLAAALAALVPALRLARTPPSELLKVFAHER